MNTAILSATLETPDAATSKIVLSSTVLMEASNPSVSEQQEQTIAQNSSPTANVDQVNTISATDAATLPEIKEMPPILSTLLLDDWQGSLTTFEGFTGTTPDIELANVSWSEISSLLAPDKPAILDDKKQGQYFVPCILKADELVGNTREAAIKNGQSTIGKMRSKSHVTEASFLTIDVDGLSKEELNAGFKKLIKDGITFLTFTTHSQGSAEKPGMRVRVITLLDRPVTVDEYSATWHGFDKQYFNGKAGEADASGANMYQQQGTWCSHPDRVAAAKAVIKNAGVASAGALIAIGVEVLAAKGIKAKPVSASTIAPRENNAKGSFNTADYPASDANKVADACYQIRKFRETKGADQSEPLWHDSLGVVSFCIDGEMIAQEWSSGYAKYTEAETARKIANRIQFAPTTCNQFKSTSPAGCAGCTQSCNSPITLGWDKESFTHVLAAEGSADTNENAVPTAMADMNKRYAFIEKYASIYRHEYSNFIEPSKLRLQHDNIKLLTQVGDSTKLVGVGTIWLGSPYRRQHKDVVMRPAEPVITHDNCLNEWQGFAVVAIQGDIRPFLRLLVRLMPNRAARRYATKWMAHLIQHPDIKMFVSLAFWSHEEGVGKNIIFELLVAIIGSIHATVIGQKELSGSFNGWAHNRVLVIGDEVSGSDKRQETDKIKGLITSTAIHVNEKFQPERSQPNLLNFIFLSNHHDAMFVSDHDRRLFVWEVTAGRLPTKQATDFINWRDSGGLEALHHFLLHYDISDFNPRAPAPMTAAKQQMVADNRSDLESWLADVMASDVAGMFGGEVVMSRSLCRAYAIATDNKAPSEKAIVGACKRLGAYAFPTQVRLKNGKKYRALSLARHDFWKAQSEATWALELQKVIQI
jgi:hypothetical protein